MRKILLGLLAVALCVCASGAQNVITVQSAGGGTDGLGPSVSQAFAQNTTAGNTILVAVDAGDTITQVSDTQGNPFVKDLGPIGGRSHLFRASNIAGGPDTVTATFASSTSATIHIVEYSGLATSSPLDGASGANGHDTEVNCASLTTANPNDLLVVYARVKHTLTSADPNYAATDTLWNWMGDRKVSEAGTYRASFAQKPSGTFECLLAAYKTGSGGSGGSPLQITTTTIPSGTVSLPYTTTLSATGGTAPYTWSVVSASLPPGLHLTSAGAIDGTPTTAGEFPFTIQVRDSVGATATKSFNITINQPAGSAHLSVSPASIDFGSVLTGSFGSQTVTLTNSGSASLSVSAAQVSGTGFSTIGLTLPLTLTAGQSSTFNAQFTPLTTGDAAGSISFVSTAPNSPVVLPLSGKGTAPTSESVELSWDPSSSTVVGYNVYRSTVPGGPYTKLNSSPIVGLSYTDSTVQSGHMYYYVATTVDESSTESGFSNEAQVTIP